MNKLLLKNFLLLSLSFVAVYVGCGGARAESDEQSKSVDAKKKIQDHVKEFEEYVEGVKEFERSDAFKSSLLEQDLPFDVNVGNKSAPVKMVEYASLSCIHCKVFHEEVFYKLKKEYIDTGKLQLKYRHYPLNGNAVKGALIVDCVNDDVKLAFLGALFKGQSQWAYAKSESALIDRLKTISKIGGLSSKEFETCYNNEENQDKLLTQMKAANESLKVDSTPAIFINGSRYLKARSFEAVSKHIDEILSKKGGASNQDSDKE